MTWFEKSAAILDAVAFPSPHPLEGVRHHHRGPGRSNHLNKSSMKTESGVLDNLVGRKQNNFIPSIT